MNTIINTDKAPAAVGPYVQAILAGNTLFSSGQLGLVPATGESHARDGKCYSSASLINSLSLA